MKQKWFVTVAPDCRHTCSQSVVCLLSECWMKDKFFNDFLSPRETVDTQISQLLWFRLYNSITILLIKKKIEYGSRISHPLSRHDFCLEPQEPIIHGRFDTPFKFYTELFLWLHLLNKWFKCVQFLQCTV